MARLTQGTQIFVLAPTKANPAVFEVFRVRQVTDVDPGSAPTDSIDVTPLEETDTRQFMPGLQNPGDASLTVMADEAYPSHVRLHELSQSKDNIRIAIGWSGSKSEPTLGGFSVDSVSMSNTGSGYTTATATFSAPPAGGTTATGTAVVAGGSVVRIDITNPGSGYVSAPTITITGAGGTGAAATAALGPLPTFNLPADRTFSVFKGYVASFPFKFGQNTKVETQVSIKRNSALTWQLKTA